MARKKWCLAEIDKEKAGEIAVSCGVDPFAALLLVARGMTDKAEIEQFFSPSSSFCSSKTICDMEKAAQCILEAIENGECIAVYGDYDADGVTASALLFLFLEMIGANVLCYIPDRESEGYGLNIGAIDTLCEQGVGLIVTVDNGISAINEAQYIYEKGMKLVVTDHHKVGPALPRAEAVVDPHREDNESEFSDWSGVGVAFKLICALSDDEYEEVLDNFADIIAVGTVADIVPLSGENRSLVKLGIEKLNSDCSLGLRALKEVCSVGDKQLGALGIAFSISPRINAIGRIDKAEKAFELLVCNDEEKAFSLAKVIDEANASRQKSELEIVSAIEQQIKQNPSIVFDRVLVFSGEGWHQGVIGIVAARMVERFSKPCIIIATNGDTARGSGRSLEGFSLYDAINSARDLLTHFGGHPLAAGLSIMSEDIEEFKKRVNAFAKTVNLPFAKTKLDLRLKPSYISTDLVDVISGFEPFGAGNAQPLFGLFGMTVAAIQPLKGGKHIRLNLVKDDCSIYAIKFSTDYETFPYYVGDRVDLAVQLDKNEFRGQVNVSIFIKDIRLSGTDDEKYLRSVRLFEKIRRGEPVSPQHAELAKPDRDFIARVYRFVKAKGGFFGDYDLLCYRLGDDGGSACRVLMSIDILCEIGIFEKEQNGIVLCETAKKVELSNSPLYNSLQKIAIRGQA